MDIPEVLASPRSVRQLLRTNGLKPRKALGQHFLVDGNMLEKMVRAIDPQKADFILEIGAGLGVLSRELAPKCGGFLAVELDEKLADILSEVLAGYPNARVIRSDFLKLNLAEFERNPPSFVEAVRLKVVGNLPYYVSGPIIAKLLLELGSWDRFVFMLQREMALRIIASPGNKDYGPISILSQCYSDVKLVVPRISPRCFYPPPEVESSIVAFIPFATRDTVPYLKPMVRLVRGVFRCRRKTVLNALGMGLGLSREQAERILVAADIAPNRRPECLEIREFARMAKAAHDEGIFNTAEIS